jgi:hypothetical protein
MSLRIKAVVEKFIKELKEALESDLQDRIMKEREMQSYIEEREREVAEREAAWKAELGRREVSVLPVASFSLSLHSLLCKFQNRLLQAAATFQCVESTSRKLLVAKLI